jgi:predicted ATPase
MINTIELKNFKGHQSTHFSFDNSRLHALVGQNGCGKTSVLQALRYFSQLQRQPKNVFEYGDLCDSIATRGSDKMSVKVTGNQHDSWQIVYEWEPEKKDDVKIIVDGKEYIHSNTNPNPKISWDLLLSVHIKLVAANLVKASYSESEYPEVGFNGLNLAPNLDYLRNEYPDIFQELQEMLKRIVPSVQRVGIRRAMVVVNRQRLIEVGGKSVAYEENQDVAGQEIVLDMNTGERIPAHAISEGTMMVLGLLTILMNPEPPRLILLDDIEQGLHPKAQRELIAVFKEIIQTDPGLQIIFTTHSPYIIDALQPSQVHVLSNGGDGFTKTKRLDEHPDVEWAKQTLTTGEFWDAEGEDWVIDGATND